MKSTSLILAGCMLLSSVISQAVAAAETLPGSTEGAQIMKFTPSQDQTDLFSNVIYSQVKDGVALRQLRMSLLVPRNNDLKPAIVYFPGGGFMTANHDKYIAMRMALANAGYVVAAAEYRVIPDKFPRHWSTGKRRYVTSERTPKSTTSILPALPCWVIPPGDGWRKCWERPTAKKSMTRGLPRAVI
jgi:hypothetical protein